MIWALFLDVLKLSLVGLIVLYAVQVLITIRTEGTHDRLRFDSNDPVRSVEQVVVWLGVRTAAAILAALKASLNILEDTSADLGEWVLNHRRS